MLQKSPVSYFQCQLQWLPDSPFCQGLLFNEFKLH